MMNHDNYDNWSRPSARNGPVALRLFGFSDKPHRELGNMVGIINHLQGHGKLELESIPRPDRTAEWVEWLTWTNNALNFL